MVGMPYPKVLEDEWKADDPYDCVDIFRGLEPEGQSHPPLRYVATWRVYYGQTHFGPNILPIHT